MSKKTVFYEIFDIVMSETEVEKSLLISSMSKSREVVDARYLLIYFLHDYAGFDFTFISKMMNMTPQGVRGISLGFENRLKQSGKFFEITFERIKKRMATGFGLCSCSHYGAATALAVLVAVTVC